MIPPEAPDDPLAACDTSGAYREGSARTRLTARLAESLPRGPWLAPGQPVEDHTLVRAACWAAAAHPGDLDLPGDVLAALALLAAARRELDQLEAALLFLARAEGVSWATIGPTLGLRTPQAAQQRADRVATRIEGSGP